MRMPFLLNSSYSNVVYEARKRLLVGILECRLRLFISHFVFICKVDVYKRQDATTDAHIALSGKRAVPSVLFPFRLF